MTTSILADTVGITDGHYAGADWSFLIALILAGIAAIAYASPPRTTSDAPRSYSYARWAPVLVAAAIALIALGLLLL